MSRPISTTTLRLSHLTGATEVISGDGDPSNGIGVAASMGAVYARTDTGELYFKRAAQDYAWWRGDGKPPWTWDALAKIGCPANGAEWGRVLEIAGLAGTVPTPIAIWNCQDTAVSAQIADANGTFNLTPSGGGLIYEQAPTGWERKGVRTSDNVAGRWSSTAAGLPDLLTDPATMFAFGSRISAISAAVRAQITMGTTESYIGGQNGTRFTSGANIATGAVGTLGNARAFYGILSDRPNARARGYDPYQKLSPAIGAVIGKQVAIGGIAVAPPTADTVYAWLWNVAPSDAEIKAILVLLGWPVAW